MMLPQTLLARWRLSFGTASLALALTGCGTSKFSKLTDSSAKPSVLLVMGGNNSCRTEPEKDDDARGPRGMSMYRFFLDTFARLQEESGIDPHYIISCYGQSTPTITYRTSENPDALNFGSLGDYYSAVDNVVANQGKVYVIGHSYGGWLAMKTAADLDMIHFAGIFSIDPISKIDCTFVSPRACTVPPPDINNDARNRIRSNSDRWENFFQTETFYLHSGPIAQATENIQRSVGHVGIEVNSGVWDVISQYVH